MTPRVPRQPPAALPVASIQARSESRALGHGLAVRSMFDRIAATYDLLNRLLSFGLDRSWRNRALAALGARLDAGAPPGPVLDLCAGTLDLSVLTLRRLPGRAVVATDFARDMLVRGRAKLRDRGHIAISDAQKLPFRERSFAGAICGFGMRNLAQPTLGLAEVHRVLKPKGALVVLDFFRPTRATTRAFHALYGQGVLPAVGALVSGDRHAYGYLARSMRGFVTRSEFAQAMRAAGFRDVCETDLTFGVASLVGGLK
ncbi:MAG: ubiquinone/menaquinone biosynthesis methyltransferase [Proteobacteria bacterium]|nr:ubiquinone/menaquinone biosynthesis methyltransferase [Pseudomonadota bacterium]